MRLASIMVLMAFVDYLCTCKLMSLSGAKIHRSGSKLRCIEAGGMSYTLEEESTSNIPVGIASYIEHTKTALQKCKDVEAAITNLEKQSLDESFFPVTIRRRPLQKDVGSPSLPPTCTSSPVSVSKVCQSSPSELPLPQHLHVCELSVLYSKTSI